MRNATEILLRLPYKGQFHCDRAVLGSEAHVVTLKDAVLAWPLLSVAFRLCCYELPLICAFVQTHVSR